MHEFQWFLMELSVLKGIDGMGRIRGWEGGEDGMGWEGGEDGMGWDGCQCGMEGAPSRQVLGDFRPLVPVQLVGSDELEVFLLRPRVTFDARVQMVVPSASEQIERFSIWSIHCVAFVMRTRVGSFPSPLPALLPDPSRKVLSNDGPLLRPELVHQLDDALVLL